MLQQYNKHFSPLKVHYKTEFELHNIPLALANSIRRGCSSLVPTITFNDEWFEEEYKRSILIKKNTSALHNEFLSHRIGLIPINMDNTELTIKSIFNNEKGEREYYFAYPEQVPKFYLKIKNDDESKKDKDGFIEITTKHFYIDDNKESDKFMVTDPFTSDPIILNKLKSNLANDDEGEELDIECNPKISMGKYNARNDPTGTVTFKFKIDDDNVDNVFKKKMDYMNKERTRKKLDIYTAEEEKQFKKSFDLLDIERVFHKNENNEPTIFQFSVESIGFLKPDQIIMDCLKSLFITLKDINNSINFKNIGTKVVVDTNPKILITETTGQRYGTSITIKNENHTIGNLLASYIRTLFNQNKNKDTDDSLLKYSAYRMNHPTIEEIELILIPETEDKNELIRFITNFVTSNSIESKDLQLDIIQNMEIYDLRIILSILILIKTINIICLQIQEISYEFSKLSGIKTSNFISDDSPEFFKKYNLFWGNFNQKNNKPFGSYRKGTAIEAVSTFDTIKLEK
jgi:DNA-directed RNA polymerase subunit L